MPTWLTGLLVTVWIARSANERPRNSQMSPVDAAAIASSSESDVSSIRRNLRKPMGSTRTTALARRKRKRAKVSLPALSGRVKRPSWKVLGLAGIAGVAATGVVVARNRRAQRDLPPDELRERLHERLAEVGADPSPHAS